MTSSRTMACSENSEEEESPEKLAEKMLLKNPELTARIFAVAIATMLDENTGIEVHLDGKLYLVHIEDGHVLIVDPQEKVH